MCNDTRKSEELQLLPWILATYAEEFQVPTWEVMQWVLEAGIKSLLEEAVHNGVEIPVFDCLISGESES